MTRKVDLLIIDDDDDYHFFIDKALEEISSFDVGGHKLFHAKELTEFLIETGYRPDAIIMDINMPFVNGFEAIKALHKSEKLKNIPVFLLTNSSNISDQLQSYELGCAGFYTKPDDAAEYKDILKEIISKVSTVSP
jgi:CheY-like chemotaxis protein